MVNMATAIESQAASSETVARHVPGATLALVAAPEERAVKTVAVVGLGYVGLPTGIALAGVGLEVIGIDVSERRLADIREGSADLLAEDQERLADVLAAGQLTLSCAADAIADADAVLICVPTPVDEDRRPDLRFLASACETVVEQARRGQLIVLTSTSYVGTTRDLLATPLAGRGLEPGTDVLVAFSPERIDPGNTDWRQEAVPRVVGGVTPECTRAAGGLIEKIAARVHPVSSPEAAELTKLYENSFRAVNIAFANEVAGVGRRFGIDPLEVIEAAGTKPYGFMKFYPGPGVGGHCIPCDPHYLLWQLRATQNNAPLVTQAMHAIAERPKQVVERVANTLSRNGKGLGGTRVLVVGVTYKPGVQDVRSSSALDIIDLLAAKGAKVGYHDPLVPNIRVTGGALDSVVEPEGGDWDVALIHTIQPGHGYDWLSQCAVVVDATYRFDPALFAN
jgi:nucleotide sugar dehydrogenase